MSHEQYKSLKTLSFYENNYLVSLFYIDLLNPHTGFYSIFLGIPLCQPMDSFNAEIAFDRIFLSDNALDTYCLYDNDWAL